MVNSKNPLKKIAKGVGKIFLEEEPKKTSEEADWMENVEEEVEGQLAIDVYQTAENIVIKAPIAGVKREDLDISITDEVVTIKGERKDEIKEAKRDYFTQECYWGAFSRVYQLPMPIDVEKASAVLRDGILTITLPKIEKLKTKTVKIEAV